MPAQFDTLTLDDARKLLARRALDAGAREALDFYAGDHWRDGDGWIGQQPPQEVRDKVMAQIAAGFVSQNVSGEVVNRHRNGILGREPRWGFVPRRALADGEEPNDAERALMVEADAALTEWWDKRKPFQLAQRAVARVLAVERAVLRLYVPIGRAEGGRVAAADLATALDAIFPDLPEPGAAGVIEDAETGREVAFCASTIADADRIGPAPAGGGNGERIELCYLDDAGATVLRVLGGPAEESAAPLPLGGRLLSYELARDPLITPQVRQLQKALNLDLTQMMRNVNLAGSLERFILNAQRPGHWVDMAGATITQQQAATTEGARFVPEPLPTGAGVSAWLSGLTTTNEQTGQPVIANPSVQWRDPVPVGTFTDTQAALYQAILAECDQLHALISKDATASGESRKQARAEFATSLLLTKAVADAALRWLLETALALAATFVGSPDRFAELRCEVGCLVDAGPLSSDERDAIMAQHEKGLLSAETAMAQLGVEDTDAELARIRAERQEGDAAFVALTNGAGGRVAPTQGGQPPARGAADVLAGELGGAGTGPTGTNRQGGAA